MKSTVRTAALAITLAALASLSSYSGTVFAAVVKPAPATGTDVSPDMNPIPNCPINDPNGCGIYSN